MNERDLTELHATSHVLRLTTRDLRARGYDASLWVEHRGDHHTAEIRVRIPPAGTPIEAVRPVPDAT